MAMLLSIVAAVVPVSTPISSPEVAAQNAPPELSPTIVRTIGQPGKAGLYGWGAATDLDGTLLLGDYWGYRIVRVSPNGDFIEEVIANPGFSDAKHQAPYGFSIAPAGSPNAGYLYLADTDRRQIDIYDETMTYVDSFGENGVLAGGPDKFKYPSRTTVHPDGTVYVADTWDNVVSAHDPDGTERFEFGGPGNALGKIRSPRGMATYVKPDGTVVLYVSEQGNKRVQMFDVTVSTTPPTSIGSFGGSGTGPGEFKGDLRGLDVDPNTGWVYAVDGQDNLIQKYDSDGNFLLDFGGSGEDPGEFFDGGREITIDHDGNVWVGDMPNFRTQKFDPNGISLLQYPNPPIFPPLGGFNAPRGVAVDADGEVFVVDTYNQRIQKFDAAGTPITEWGRRGFGDYRFNYPRLIAIDPRNQDVLVMDTDNARVKRYDNNGVFISSFGEKGPGDFQFSFSRGIDVAADGTIAVADSLNSRVALIDTAGNWSDFGVRGNDPGELRYPRDVAFDDDGTLWVTDSTRDDVQHFAADGTLLGAMPYAGNSPEGVNNPFGIDVDDNYVFVAATAGHEVQVYDKSTMAYVLTIGSKGSDLGELDRPQGITVVDGHLYVAEHNGDRISVFSLYDDEPEPGDGLPVFDSVIGGPGGAQMYPSGVETHPDGGIVVSDIGNGALHRIADDGTILWTAGDQPGDVSNLTRPRDVAVHEASGSTAVADTGNSRIVIFDSAGNYVRDFRSTPTGNVRSLMGLSFAGDKLYVADGAARLIRIFMIDGTHVADIGSDGACQLAALRDVDAATNGDIYVANYTSNNILRFDASGNCVGSWGSTGELNGEFRNPYGVSVALDPVVGIERVFVSDSNNSRTQIFGLNGNHIRSFGSYGEPGDASKLHAARRVAVASDGDVWVADQWGFKVVRYDRTASGYVNAGVIGNVLAPNTSTESFNEPRSMAWAADGTLVTIDTVGNRVVRMATDDTLIDTCGRRGWVVVGEYNFPRGVTVTGSTGEIWVADTKQNRLHVLDSACSPLVRFGTGGNGPDGFNWPHALTYRAQDDTVWVADTRNQRIKVYDTATRALVQTYDASDVGGFNQPRGLSVDPVTGSVYVADTRNDRVLALDGGVGGAAITGRVVLDTGLNDPEGVAIDDQGHIAIADTGNNRVVFMTEADGELAIVDDGFLEPAAVAYGPAGHLYVADTGNDRVVRYRLEDGGPPPVDTPPDGSITDPERLDTIQSPVLITGEATDDSGVASVKIAIQDVDTRQWLQADGVTWAAQYHRADATLGTPGASLTTWSTTFTGTPPGASGRFNIQVNVTDDAGQVDPERDFIRVIWTP